MKKRQRKKLMGFASNFCRHYSALLRDENPPKPHSIKYKDSWKSSWGVAFKLHHYYKMKVFGEMCSDDILDSKVYKVFLGELIMKENEKRLHEKINQKLIAYNAESI